MFVFSFLPERSKCLLIADILKPAVVDVSLSYGEDLHGALLCSNLGECCNVSQGFETRRETVGFVDIRDCLCEAVSLRFPFLKLELNSCPAVERFGEQTV